MRWVASLGVAALVLAIGLAAAPAHTTITSGPSGPLALPRERVPYLPADGSQDVFPAGDPSNEPDMDHEGKRHHHHQHLADHRGAGHSAAGLGEHHHHHHNHPHGPDPHHHHPH